MIILSFLAFGSPKKSVSYSHFSYFFGSLHTVNTRYLKTFLFDTYNVEVIDKNSLGFIFFSNICSNVVKHFAANYERKLYLSYSIFKKHILKHDASFDGSYMYKNTFVLFLKISLSICLVRFQSSLCCSNTLFYNGLF